MIAEIILLLSVILLTLGIYLQYGVPIALIVSGVYFGVIAFSIAIKRTDS